MNVRMHTQPKHLKCTIRYQCEVRILNQKLSKSTLCGSSFERKPMSTWYSETHGSRETAMPITCSQSRYYLQYVAHVSAPFKDDERQ